MEVESIGQGPDAQGGSAAWRTKGRHYAPMAAFEIQPEKLESLRTSLREGETMANRRVALLMKVDTNPSVALRAEMARANSTRM